MVCWLVIGVLWLLVNRTRAGKAVLAASMNPRGVTLLGVELSQVYIAIWAIYGLLVGVAGVLAFSVSARTREFGVRLAIGAQPRQLLTSVIAEGAVMATAGVAAGAAFVLMNIHVEN